MCILLFTRYFLSSINCLYRNHCTTDSLTASRPPRTCFARGLRKVLTPPPLTSEFMGMASYAPTYFYELVDDEVESDGSSIGDVAPSHHLSREYAMADTLG